MEKSGNFSFLDAGTTLALVLYPILSYYIGPFHLSYGIWLFIIIMFVKFISSDFSNIFSYPDRYFSYWAYAAITLCLFSFEFKLTQLIPGGVTLFVFSLILGFSIKNINSYLLVHIYRIVFLISASIFVFQEIILFLDGTMIPVVLPICDEFGYGGGKTYIEIIAIQSARERASSLFMESSYFAQFCIPLLALELFNLRNKQRIFSLWSILIIVVIIFTKSGCGYLCASILVIIKIVTLWKSLSNSFRFSLLLLIPIIVFGISLFLTTEIGAGMLERTDELNMSNGETSGFLRIFRGYIIYGELPFFYKIFGISFEDISNLHLNSLFLTGDIAADSFCNGIQTVLITKGFIGLVLLCVCYSSLYKQNTILGKSLILCFLALSLTEATYVASTMMMFTTLAANEKLKLRVSKE